MADFTIYIGNKNYSSWSLRAWLMLKASGLRFEEVLIPLWEAHSKAELLRHSPTGKVPALRHGAVTVWESLAIGEYLAEQAPDFPMNMRASVPGRDVPPEVRLDLERVAALWLDCRRRFGAGGAYLFGPFTVADAMFAPVVSRLRTYQIALEDEAQSYADALWAYAPLQEWANAARSEPMVVQQFEL
jgi:glutathione S-transferase